MRVAVGTSGDADTEWKGSFYPADLPAHGMLRFYGSRFGAVEVNSTFYRMPTEKVLVGWAAGKRAASLRNLSRIWRLVARRTT